MSVALIAAAYIVLCWKVASLVGRFIDQMGGPDDE